MRIAAPVTRLHDVWVSNDEYSTCRRFGGLGATPFSLVHGDNSLQGSKRGTVSEGHKGSRLHGPYRADEASDDDIAGLLLRLPL